MKLTKDELTFLPQLRCSLLDHCLVYGFNCVDCPHIPNDKRKYDPYSGEKIKKLEYDPKSGLIVSTNPEEREGIGPLGRYRLDAGVKYEKAKAIGEIAWEAFDLLGKANYAMGIVVDMTKGKVHTNFEEGQEKVKQAKAIIKDILPIREK